VQAPYFSMQSSTASPRQLQHYSPGHPWRASWSPMPTFHAYDGFLTCHSIK